MPKKIFKLWFQVEQITGDDDLPEDYENLGEPFDVVCASEGQAYRVQRMLQQIGDAIANHENMIITGNDGSVITGTETYEHCGKTENYKLQCCELSDPQAAYWVAHAGTVCGVKVLEGQTCINTIEKVWREIYNAARGFTYIIWPLRDATPSSIARWTKKWSARTKAGLA